MLVAIPMIGRAMNDAPPCQQTRFGIQLIPQLPMRAYEGTYFAGLKTTLSSNHCVEQSYDREHSALKHWQSQGQFPDISKHAILPPSSNATNHHDLKPGPPSFHYLLSS